MNFEEIDRYLARLRVELRNRGLVDVRIVEEARGHLVDATEQGIQRGLPADAAQREAVARFGSAESLQSLIVVDDGGASATRTRKYQAVFGDERRIICTVEVGGAGKHVSIHWSRAAEPKFER